MRSPLISGRFAAPPISPVARWRTSSGRAGASPRSPKIESGRQMLTEDEVRAWAEVTRSDVNALLALHHRAQHEFETFRDAYLSTAGEN
jgi:hypothetical protein